MIREFVEFHFLKVALATIGVFRMVFSLANNNKAYHVEMY